MEKSKDKEVYAFGIVTEALPNALFRVELEASQKTIIAYLAGKMRLHRIKVLVGDKVKVVVDSYGERGRIVQRL